MTLLCRVAENMFWLNRYVERAIAMIRVLDVTAHLELDAGDSGAHAMDFWTPLLGMGIGLRNVGVSLDGPLPQPREVRYFLAFDVDNANSLTSCVRSARAAARQVRDSLSSEIWEQINTSYLRLVESGGVEALEDDLHGFSRRTRDGLLLVQGLADATMAHDEAWQFLSLGMYLERADNISRLLERQSHLLTPEVVAEYGSETVRWLAVLRSAGSAEAYAHHYSLRVDPVRVLEFLLLNPLFPQAVAFSLSAAWRALQAISHLSSVQSEAPLRALVRLRASLEHASVDEVLEYGLEDFLLRMRGDIAEVSDHITRAYFRFAPLGDRHHAVARAAQIMAAQQQQQQQQQQQ
jgi:uncharacterized alpha-E superfamily protein